MANIYTWVIDSMDTVPFIQEQTNVVSCVHYHVNATDGTYNTTIYVDQPLQYVTGSSFTDYANLTENMVIKWVQEIMDTDAVTALQKTLDKQLESLANPPVVSLPLPWLA
jgi:hypothetical protein